jgi:8-oxo-dGTP pyrophosphatase MutT (NUDIX family)
MTEQAFEDMGALDTPVRAPTGRAVRPRHAATLILVRRDAAEPRVLMGRRHGRHDFMPDKWVFPGGRIDPSDYRATSASELRPDVASRLEKTAPAARARALALTAVRETFEETGLLLARPAEPRSVRGPWRDFYTRGVAPDLAPLSFVARAITPPISPKRFDARFFLADAEALVSLERGEDCGELDEIAWVSLSDALKLDLPSVTRFVLRELPHRFADPQRAVPSLSFARGKQAMTVL